MRIFYAFPLPEEVADWLYKTSLALREKLAGGKVTPKENLHITAAFVGNVNEIKTDILSQILRRLRQTTRLRRFRPARPHGCAART